VLAIFVLGFSFLLVHEMDAIRLREWRILPVPSRLDDSVGQIVIAVMPEVVRGNVIMVR
jgi:hypothetical protein